MPSSQAVKELIAVSNWHRRFLLGMLSMPSTSPGKGENRDLMQNGNHAESHSSDPWHWDPTESTQSTDRFANSTHTSKVHHCRTGFYSVLDAIFCSDQQCFLHCKARSQYYPWSSKQETCTASQSIYVYLWCFLCFPHLNCFQQYHIRGDCGTCLKSSCMTQFIHLDKLWHQVSKPSSVHTPLQIYTANRLKALHACHAGRICLTLPCKSRILLLSHLGRVIWRI